MKPLTTLNFANYPLLLIDCEENLSNALEKSLSRMGLIWSTNQEQDKAKQYSAALVDIQNLKNEEQVNQLQKNGTAIIAITAHEGLKEMQRVIDLGATALLHKPITQRAIYSTLIMAISLKNKIDSDALLINRLNKKRDLVPLLAKTIAQLMSYWKIDETEAYNWIRTEAMKNNQTIEQVCLSLNQLNKWRK